MRRRTTDPGPSGTSMHDRTVSALDPEPAEPTKLRILRKYLKDRLPITKWLPHYTRQDIVPDAVAGITVGKLFFREQLRIEIFIIFII